MKKSEKILLVLRLPPPYGGGEILSEYLFKKVIDKENFIVISTSRKNSNKLTQGKFSVSNIFSGIKLLSKVAYYLIRFKPNLVYISIPKQFKPFLKTAFIIIIASSLKIKVYGELAGDNFLFLRKDNYEKKIGLFFLKKITELRVLGASVKNNLAQYQLCKLVVIDNGIYVPPDIRISETLSSSPLNLLFVGALNFSKGIKNLIESLNLLKKEQVEIHLNIMGEWSNKTQEKEILGYIESNSLNNLITFNGLVTDNKKWEIYKKSSLLVHPTFWDGQPLVLLEAMGCGLPIISTKVGAIPDTMIHNYNGIILPENNPAELTKAIKYFDQNRQKLSEISNNNIQTYRKKFTIDSYTTRMINWLERQR